MDKDAVTDLKQFITVSVSQQISGLREYFDKKIGGVEAKLSQKIDGLDHRMDGLDYRMDGLDYRIDGLDQRIDGLDQKIDDVGAGLTRRIDSLDSKLSAKIDDLSVAVAEAIDTNNADVDRQLKNHERRIIKIEHRL